MATLRLLCPLLLLLVTCIQTKLLSKSSVVKTSGKPLLRVVEPNTNSIVHLVGVSHGSPISAELVETVISKVKPDVIVLELCEDRYISMSLDNKIVPTGNETMKNIYYDKLGRYSNRNNEKNGNNASILAQFYGTCKFAKGQGLVAGTFVLLGIFVSYVQRLSRSNNLGDEFITAMSTASNTNIPIRLCDAPQNDTLASIKSIVSRDTFSFSHISRDTKLFLFSAFGLLKQSANDELNKYIRPEVLDKSEFINIPKIYLDDTAMIKSLLPILIILSTTTIIGFFPPATPTGSHISLTDLNDLNVSDLLSLLFTSELPPPYNNILSFCLDVFYYFVLIRMAKLIGTNRDIIISENIQNVCREFPPGSNVVVVLGMLHLNGVGKWILSGTNKKLILHEINNSE